MQLNSDDEIRFIIQSEDILLRKLPWHLWHFFSDYPKVEIGLSSIEFETQTQVTNHTQQVKILAILGDSQGINIDTDRRILESLPSAKIVFSTQRDCYAAGFTLPTLPTLPTPKSFINNGFAVILVPFLYVL